MKDEQQPSVKATLYLVHLTTPLHHAQHYMGAARPDRFEARIECHRNNRGSAFLRAVNLLGIEWKVVRTWDGMTFADEQRIKRNIRRKLLCPVCNPDSFERHGKKKRGGRKH